VNPKAVSCSSSCWKAIRAASHGDGLLFVVLWFNSKRKLAANLKSFLESRSEIGHQLSPCSALAIHSRHFKDEADPPLIFARNDRCESALRFSHRKIMPSMREGVNCFNFQMGRMPPTILLHRFAQLANLPV